MTKLNFIQAKHPQALSYAIVQSDPVAEPEPKKALVDRLEDLAVGVMFTVAALCGATGFMVWVFIILAFA